MYPGRHTCDYTCRADVRDAPPSVYNTKLTHASLRGRRLTRSLRVSLRVLVPNYGARLSRPNERRTDGPRRRPKAVGWLLDRVERRAARPTQAYQIVSISVYVVRAVPKFLLCGDRVDLRREIFSNTKQL